MLRDLADNADKESGVVGMKMGEIVGLHSSSERSVQRMLAYLHKIGAIDRSSVSGRGGFVRLRLCIEEDPSIIQRRVNFEPPLANPGKGATSVTFSDANGVTDDTIGTGNHATDDTFETRNGATDDTFSSRADGSPTESRHTPVSIGLNGSTHTVKPSSGAARANGHTAAPLLTMPPTLTDAEHSKLVGQYTARFQTIDRGPDEISAALERWAASAKAALFPDRFPLATSWLMSAAEWLDGDLVFLKSKRAVPTARGRPTPSFDDHGFTEGRTDYAELAREARAARAAREARGPT